jgi:hypothetical protein
MKNERPMTMTNSATTATVSLKRRYVWYDESELTQYKMQNKDKTSLVPKPRGCMQQQSSDGGVLQCRALLHVCETLRHYLFEA